MLALALAAAVACGPPHAHTLAHNAQARVYLTGRDAIACSGHRTRRLGRVATVKLAGPHLLVGRDPRPGTQTLALYDLQHGRVDGRTRVDGRFTATRLDASGFAVYIATALDGAISIGPLTEGGFLEPITNPTFLRLASGTVAWETPFGIALTSPDEDDDDAPGTLFRGGPFRLDVNRGHYLVLHGSGWSRLLDSGLSECGLSSSGCFGIDMVQQVGDRLAVHDVDFGRDSEAETLTVYDAEGHPTTPCAAFGALIERFVLGSGGAVACSVGNAIYSDGQVLDSGPDIDTNSLQRRGDSIVWLHAGAERTAPLPTN